jgi:hypothetical protein
MPDSTSLPRWLSAVALVVVLWFLVSWPVGLLLEPGRLGRPGELEYFLADFLILLPLALAALAGLRRRAGWALPLFLLMTGGLAYSALHFTVHLVRGQSSTPARAGLVAGVVLLLAGLAVIARRVIRMLTGGGAGG